MKQKKILFIATWGTFASIKTSEGLKPGFHIEELLNLFPESKTIAHIDGIQIAHLDSSNIEPKHWTLMTQTIQKNYDAYDGFIIAHGTDTMHYSSAALSFSLKGIQKPVVFTGSVLSPQEENSDAKDNFLDSIRTALSEDLAGVFICFMGLVIHGTHARKMNNESTRISEKYKEVFGSIGLPVVGVISGKKCIRNQNCTYWFKKDAPKFESCFENVVGNFNLVPWLNSDILEYFQTKKAILIEAFWPGNIPFTYGNWIDAISKISKKGIAIFITTQNPFGEVDMNKYEVGQKALKAWAIPCYDMTPETALVKLMWIYGNHTNPSPEKVKKLFLTNLTGELRESHL
jgi:L-asparaginase